MRSLLKWVYYLAAFLTLLVILNYLLLPQILVNVLKNKIEIEGSEATGLKITVDSVKMTSLYPFYIQFQRVRAVGESLSFSIESLEFKVEPKYKNAQILFDTELRIDKPQVSLRTGESAESGASPIQGEKVSDPISWWNRKLFGIPVQFPLDLKIQGGDIKVKYQFSNWIEFSDTNLQILKESMLDWEDMVEIDLKSVLKIRHEEHSFQLPLSAETKELFVSPAKLGSKSIRFSLGGVDSVLKGGTELGAMSHSWDLSMNIPALEKLPVPAAFLPPGKWYGGLAGTVAFRQRPGGSPELFSSFKTNNLVGDVDFNIDDLSAKGRLRALLSWQIELKAGELRAPKLNVSLSADDLAVKKGELFVKAAKMPLNFQMEGYVTKNVLVLKKLNAVLAQIRLGAAGFIGLTKSLKSDVTLKIPDTALSGLEKLFPPLAQQPAKGRLSVEARVVGEIFKGIEGLAIVAKPIRLAGFSTMLNYRDDKTKTYLIGPVLADLQAIVKSQGVKVGNTTVQGEVDLSKLEIGFGDVFQKTMGDPLRLKVRVGNSGENLTTSGSSLQIGNGELKVAGTVSGFADPRMRLQLILNQLPIHQVLKMSGYYEEIPMNGELSGSVSLVGQWKAALGIEKSPLQVQGELYSKIQSLSLKSEETPKSQDTPDIEVPKLQDVHPLAPQWPVIKNLQMSMKGTIKRLAYNDLVVGGISYKADIAKGNVSATANIQKFFGGSLSVRQFKVPILRANPRVKTNATLKSARIEQLLKFAIPKYEKEASGAVDVKLDVSTELPSSVRFMSGLKGLLSLVSSNLAVSSLQLDKAVNEALKKLPKGKMSPVKTEGFQGKVALIAAFAEGQAKLNTLNVSSVKKDELNLKGDVGLAGELNLRGTMSLASPPMSGDIYLCNRDNQGRFMVPINVKGKWNEPSLSFASTTVEALLKKTLQCQVRKQKKQLNNKLDKELKEAQDKVTKDIEKDLKKNLKNLFK